MKGADLQAMEWAHELRKSSKSENEKLTGVWVMLLDGNDFESSESGRY